jgi:hypothetical protein
MIEGMGGTQAPDLSDIGALTRAVHDELLALRGAHGRLTVQKFSQYPVLRRVCGGDDLLDAYLMFERELRRYTVTGNRNEAAAAISISAPAETVIDRLELVVSHFEEEGGETRDQRTGRRWSNQGLKTIAIDLVHMADVRGRLGQELVTIEIAGTRATGLKVMIWHLSKKHLDGRAPIVRFWKHRGDDLIERPQELTVDLKQVDAPEASNDAYRLKRYHILAELPAELSTAEVDIGDALYSISVEGPDAPMRTVSFIDESELGDDLTLRFTTYRTIVTVEVVKGTLKN